MTTGERIKERRLELGMTAEELGEKIGVSKTTIGRYERQSIKKIPYINLMNIACALNTSVQDLASDEKEPAESNGELTGMIDSMALLQNSLIRRLKELTPNQLEMVDAYVQGLLASRRDESAPHK